MNMKLCSKYALILFALVSLGPLQGRAMTDRSVNAKTDFGAVGDGVVDDTVALQNALDYLSTNLLADAGVCLYLPQGTYLISNRLSFASANALGSYQGLTIRGDGKEPGQTKLCSKSEDGALFVAVDSSKNLYNFKVQVEDLQISAGIPNAGAAIEIAPDQDSTNLSVRVTPHVENVKITRDDSSCYFSYGLKGDHFRNPTMVSVDIVGNRPGMKAAFYAGRSYAYALTDCTIADADVAVDAPYSAEGNDLSRCIITNANIGVRMFVDPGEVPGPSSFGGGIFNSSISATQTGVSMDRKQYFFVVNNRFSKIGAGAGYTNIDWANVQHGIISGNQFAGGGDQRGIVLENGGINTIAYNDFGSFTESVLIGSDVSNVKILDNSNIQTNIVDNGINTYIRHEAMRPFYDSPARCGTTNEDFRWRSLVYEPMVNVTDYGAKGDGVTDDTAAILNAAKQTVTNLNMFGQGSLYFPAGNYKLSERIDLPENTAAWQGISIFGDGDQVSTIEQAGTNGILKITCANQVPIRIHDLAMKAGSTNTQTAIEVIQEGGTSNGNRSLVLHNVQVTREYGTYFKTGISGCGLVRPLFKNVSVDLAVGFDTLGISLEDGYGAEFEQSSITFCDAGVNINNRGGAILLQGTICVAWADPGLRVDAGGGTVALQNSHIDTVNNLVVTNAGEFSFVDTLTLNREDGDCPDHATLRIASCTNIVVRDNMFSQSGTGREPNTERVSVVLAGNANSNVDISGNMFDESGTGLVIAQGSGNVVVYDNRFLDRPETTIINDEPSASISMLPGEEMPTASYRWNVDADGLFLAASNWVEGVAPGQTALLSDSMDVAVFTNAISAARTVTLDGANRNIAGFTFGSSGGSGYTLATSGGWAYYLTAGSVIQTLSGTGGHVDTISAGLHLYGNTTFANYATSATGLKFSGNVTGRASSGAATLTLAGGSVSGQNFLPGVISDGTQGGKLAIVKNGPGTWTLSANNTFTGGLTVNQGTMRYYGTGTALGRGAVTINDGATLNHANTSATIITNAMTANGNFSIAGGAGTQWGGTMDLSGGTRTMTVKVNSEFGTALSNGGLIKAGSSTLTLSAGSTYGGGTTISEGTLVADAAGALGTGSVTNNATLVLSNAACLDADAALVLSSDCTLTLDYSGTTTLATLSLDGGATYLDAGSYDAAALTALGSGTYAGSGILNVYVPGPLEVDFSLINGSDMVLGWQGSASMKYTLQHRSDLQSGSWSNILENIDGLDATMYVTSSVAGDVSFYRVISD